MSKKEELKKQILELTKEYYKETHGQVTVVGKPQATVITSSPRLIWRSPSCGEVNAENASRLAEEPELVSEQ